MYQKFKRFERVNSEKESVPCLPRVTQLPSPGATNVICLLFLSPEIQKQRKLYVGMDPFRVDKYITVWEIISGQRGAWAEGASLSQPF